MFLSGILDRSVECIAEHLFGNLWSLALTIVPSCVLRASMYLCVCVCVCAKLRVFVCMLCCAKLYVCVSPCLAHFCSDSAPLSITTTMALVMMVMVMTNDDGEDVGDDVDDDDDDGDDDDHDEW